MKKKTNQTDYLGGILLLVLWALVFVQIGCGLFGDTTIVAPWSMLIYAICTVIGAIKLRENNKIIKLVLVFLCAEAIQIVPYLVILAVKGLL